MMKRDFFCEKLRNARNENRRLVMPLVGFPGLTMTGCTIKLAQQNYGEHFRVLKAIAETFQPDAIFPLMDLSVEANAMGRYTVFPQEDSATVVRADFSLEELTRREPLNIAFDARLLGYVETMKLMCLGLPADIVKGAYVTGPYTLAALLMGADEAAMATVLRADELHEVCRMATERIQQYVRMLVAAGANAICVLEPSAVMLGPEQFSEFSANYVRHIVEGCKHAGVATIYHICGKTMHLVENMAAAGVDALSLDSPEAGVNLEIVAQRVPPEVAIIGNLNPTGAILTGQPHEVEAEVDRLLESMADYPNFVLSTGCDLPQQTPLENIHAFMRAGRRYRLG